MVRTLQLEEKVKLVNKISTKKQSRRQLTKLARQLEKLQEKLSLEYNTRDKLIVIQLMSKKIPRARV